MRLSSIITDVRDLLHDQGTTQLISDQEISRYVDSGVRYMFRWQAQLDETYHNLEYSLPGSAAVQLHANVFLYQLPRWTYRVWRVRETKIATDAVGRTIQESSAYGDSEGWKFDGAKRLRLVGHSEAPDLTLSIVKVPAFLHQGACHADGAALTMLTAAHPAASSSAYRFENEPDAYANALFEITAGEDGARDPVGQVRRVVSSERSGSGTVYRTQLTIETAWLEIPDEGDEYEMHPETDDAHARFLVLLATQYAFEKHHNVGGLAAINKEFMDERKRYIDSCAPRDDGLPAFWGTDLDTGIGTDRDRDFLLGRFGGF